MALEKISSQQVQALLKQAGTSIRSLTDENQNLKEKLATWVREDRIVKVAQEMDEKGLNNELDFEQKVAALRTADDLEATERAVQMTTPQGVKLASASDTIDGGGGMEPGNQSKAALEMFIATGDAPE